ncbi:MAG: NF038122 family metalloprotease [Planctomycetota bacterium]
MSTFSRRAGGGVIAAGLVSLFVPIASANQPVPIDRELRVMRPGVGGAHARCALPSLPEKAQITVAIDALNARVDAEPAQNFGLRMGLDIQYVLDAAVAADPDFVAGLEEAAQAWESIIADPAVVRISVGFVSNQSYIAAAGSSRYNWDYTSLRNGIVADASPQEAAYVSQLPAVMTAQDDAGDYNSAVDDSVIVRDSEFQSLGNASIDTGSPDNSIVFNTDFAFDTDPSDGISAGETDLVYVMIHEIGHVLGFSSTVDTSLAGRPNALDFFRMGALGASNDPDNLAEFNSFDREHRANVEAALDPLDQFSAYAAPLRFSTGRNNGDGRQASHWKDDAILGGQAIGVMDPTYQGPQQLPAGYITDADLLALSVIGWDIVLPGSSDPCAFADITTDGSSNGIPDNAVTLSDFSFYLSLWSTGDPASDITLEGVCDVIAGGGDGTTLSDFSCYLSEWSLGCP